MPSKNLTLALDAQLLQKVRVLAAMRQTSVTQMVRDYFQKEVEAESQADETVIELLELSRNSKARMGTWRWNRDETYTGAKRFDRWS